MIRYTLEDDAPTGRCYLIYSKPGIGKTYSLGTLPDPILLIYAEPRDPRVVLRPYRGKKKFDIRIYQEFDEYNAALDSLFGRYQEWTKKGKPLPYKSICFDSLSFIQSKFKMDFEDERYEIGVDEINAKTKMPKKREGMIVDRFGIEQGDWGSLSSAMKRLTRALNRFSGFGMNIVCTATLSEHVTWNAALDAAPHFIGKDYGNVFTGYFDFIGLVEPGEVDPFPPQVHFVGGKKFVAKCCSPTIVNMGGTVELDFSKIIKLTSQDGSGNSF